MANLKFYKNSNTPSNSDAGAIWFNSDKKTINLKEDSGWTQYGLSNDNLYEGNLKWGGPNNSNLLDPISSALTNTVRANKLAFYPKTLISASYSRDGGTTWAELDSNNESIYGIFGINGNLNIGNSSESGIDKSNYMARLILTFDGSVYTTINKFVLYINTSGSFGSYVTIEGRVKANVTNNIDQWTMLANKATLGGWPGWNAINTPEIWTYGGSNDQYSEIRFTFGVESHPASVQYQGLFICNIKAFGPVGMWSNGHSNMSGIDHLYNYDNNQNAIFPANITTSGNITGNKVFSEGYSVARQEASNNFISSGNELNFVNDLTMKATDIWFNYRNSNTKIENVYMGAGRAGKEDCGNNVANIIANGYKISGNESSSKVLTSDGGVKDISTLEVAKANALTWELYE